jgi:hypothetical protein
LRRTRSAAGARKAKEARMRANRMSVFHDSVGQIVGVAEQGRARGSGEVEGFVKLSVSGRLSASGKLIVPLLLVAAL